MSLLAALVRVAVAAPLPFLGVVWWVLARRARALRLPAWWLGVPALLYVYRHRRDLRGLIVWCAGVGLALLWVTLLLSSPGFRFAVGVALPVGVLTAVWVFLAANYGDLPPLLAARMAVAEWRHREVLVEAVEASATGARVVSVRPLDDGQVEAEIIGPAGMSHADLLVALNDTLAESVLSLSGRVMRNVAVIGNGAKGAVKVRCSTSSLYGRTVSLEDL